MVDCTGLENRRTARYREFESPSLRFVQQSSETPQGPVSKGFVAFFRALTGNTPWQRMPPSKERRRRQLSSVCCKPTALAYTGKNYA